MAYSGYLIKLKGGTAENLPMKYMKAESYSCTPDQRMETSATRASTGILRRTTAAHKATKIEFTTPPLTNKDIAALNTLLQNHFTNALERKITISFYNNETDSYRDATCYMPDVQYPIMRVDGNTIHYDSIRLAFIEY